jgi:hypothetical protein
MLNHRLIGNRCFILYKIIEQNLLNKVIVKIRVFEGEKKSIVDQYEQLPWTEIYRPRHSQTYLGNHTKQIRRLNDWFSHWTKKLKNEQPKKPVRKGRKRGRNNDEDNSDEDFIDDSSRV